MAYTPVDSNPEFQRIAQALQEQNEVIRLGTTYVAPSKPRAGDIRLADGVNWQPNGSGGAGVWCYYNNTWTKLG